MKRILALLGFLGLITLSPISHAQIYLEVDHCSNYISGCLATVDKCRYAGVQFCVVSDQIPCEDACEPEIGG